MSHLLFNFNSLNRQELRQRITVLRLFSMVFKERIDFSRLKSIAYKNSKNPKTPAKLKQIEKIFLKMPLRQEKQQNTKTRGKDQFRWTVKEKTMMHKFIFLIC